MRFGHFFYPMKFDDSRDDQAIHECLEEAELVEELGFDAIWLAEHYFTGGVCLRRPRWCSPARWPSKPGA